MKKSQAPKALGPLEGMTLDEITGYYQSLLSLDEWHIDLWTSPRGCQMSQVDEGKVEFDVGRGKATIWIWDPETPGEWIASVQTVIHELLHLRFPRIKKSDRSELGINRTADAILSLTLQARKRRLQV